MKGRIFNILALPILVFLLTTPGYSQNSGVKIYSTTDSSCMTKVSAYRTFFKAKHYQDAYPTWLIAFEQCSDSSERIYVDGATMYRSFIESAPDGPRKEGLIDTLMLIYDRRLENFGGEGNVLSRKGKDLLTYRGGDLVQVQEANKMFRRSIELMGTESREATFLLCISSGIALNKNNLLGNDQLIEDYILVIGNLIKLENKRARWKRIRSKVDEMLLKEELLTCKILNNYFEPRFEQSKEDSTFLESVISCYNTAECKRSEIYTAASENLYRIKPGPESAHNLAIRFISLNDLEKASLYLNEALQGDKLDNNTRGQWIYELAVVSYALNDACQSIEYGREAIRLNSDIGEAYVLLGDAFIASRKNLGDEFQKRTAYWAAADMYEKAARVDPALAEESGKKLAKCMTQFPDKEDIFFSDTREGEAYQVDGCINENTLVRARK